MAQIDDEALRRAEALEAFEAIPLARHEEMIRLVLAEASLLADRYRHVRRHDIPHMRELAGLIDVLWQEVAMAEVLAPGASDHNPVPAGGAFRHWHAPEQGA